MIEGWKYYNHAVVPITPPDETPNLKPIENNSIWNKQTYIARWTSDWDCDHETNWWYVIKDTPFDITGLKSKRRYEINKGNKNFLVKEIIPADYSDEIFNVTSAAYKTYSESYRPRIMYDSFIAEIKNWNFYKVYGAFAVEDNLLSGYACLIRNGRYIDFCMMKAIPEKEHLGVNAAMVNKILVDHENFLCNGGYICDGARSIQHETAFQDYLEKYFFFRKAYCKLNVRYKPILAVAIKLLYPFRKIFRSLETISLFHKLNVLLKMEEIRESFD